MKRRTVILIILDGWGIGRNDYSNPIHMANPQNINYIKSNFPTGALQASGISVGLPWGEEGNSEVGHLNMGTGRIIYQNFPRITLSIRKGDFFQNQIIRKAFDHAKANNSNINLFGLLTEANVHSSFEHLEALLKFAENENLPSERINLHLITDGRDSPPRSAMQLLQKLPNSNQLASIAGRYYSMDRDGHWERTQEAYQMMIGEGNIIKFNDIKSHLNRAYERNLNDEYILPTLVGPQKRPVQENDSIIFFNFREDRMKQIVRAFTETNFNKFPVKKFSNLYSTTMIEYDKTCTFPVIFPPEKIEVPLGKILADRGKIQLRVAETEKYAHITYFFNGLREEPFENEYRVLIPSQSAPHDKHPEMRAKEICQRIVAAIEENAYDFILTNFANSDMIAHTGNFNATVEAVKIVDEEIGKIVKAVLENNAILLITSDHGNAERLLDPQTGEAETKHDASPVPIYLIAKEFQREKSPAEIRQSESAPLGVLADISPTVLELLGIKKPKEMTAQSLLDFLL